MNAPVEIKTKPSLSKWWLLAIPMLLLLLFFVQLFGRGPAVRVSHETTRVTTHLGPDGLPQYTQYIHDKSNPGVPPEENAAVPIWQAMWPGELNGSARDQKLLCEALGIETPQILEALVPVYSGQNRDKIQKWLMKRHGIVLKDVETDEAAEEFARFAPPVDGIIDLTQSHPWTAEDVPDLGRWVQENKKPLDLLVEGANREKYYSPSPSYLKGEESALVMTLLPGVQMLRTSVRALKSRAMNHVGEGRNMEAWRDLQASQKIARHAAKGSTVVELLVGIAIDSMAADGIPVLLHEGNPTEAEALQILAELQEMPSMPSMAKQVDEGERLMYLDIAKRLSTGQWSLPDLIGVTGMKKSAMGSAITSLTTKARIDWNHVMEEGNETYDRIVAIVDQPRAERIVEFGEFEAELANRATPLGSPGMITNCLFSTKSRSDAMANVLIGLLVPALSAVTEASDRSDLVLDLNRIAAALAVHRARHGSYPESLDELVPDVLETLPEDTFAAGKPPIYRRQGNGYVLYSVFKNGVDDGATHVYGDIVKGKWDKDADMPAPDEGDWVLLVPRPPFELPEVRPLAVPTDDPFGDLMEAAE